MQHWIDELTPLRCLAKNIPAATYNRIRIGLLRLGTPLYLPLEEFPTLRCALDRRVWLVFDDVVGGIPLLAWLGFARSAEAGLHQPVACELRAFHHHAGLIMGRALDAVERAVAARLDADDAPVGRRSCSNGPVGCVHCEYDFNEDRAPD
jgi:hypothetical protein